MGMFGLGKDKKAEGAFTFVLEKEMQDPKNYQEYIREILRKGADKKLYEEMGILLHGYAALLKVIGKMRKK
jgi:hypothetical protein